MNFKPILFSTPMVRKILDGLKTQTRRKVKSQKKLTSYEGCAENGHFKFWKDDFVGTHIWLTKDGEFLSKPKANIGDVFWVRETWQHTKCLNLNWQDENYGYVYMADDQPWEDYEGWTWKPSIFMPKEACRIFLKVTNVHVERLHDISEEDAIAEGIEVVGRNLDDNTLYRDYMKKGIGTGILHAPNSFFTLWESINGKESLESNPWVWVYDFERTEKPENFL